MTHCIRRLAVGSVAGLVGALLGAVPASAAPGLHHGPPNFPRGPQVQKAEMGFFEQWGIYSTPPFDLSSADDEGEVADLTDLDYAFGGAIPESGASDNSGSVLAVPAAPVQEDPSQPGYNPVVCTSIDAWADYQTPGAGQVTDTNGNPEPPVDSPLAGNFEQLALLKEKYPDLKVMMSLGGFNGSAFFSAAASTPEARKTFVSSCIKMFIEGDSGYAGGPNSDQGLPITSSSQTPIVPAGTFAGLFNGFDIDWEYPCGNGVNNGATGNICDYNGANDREDLVLLMQEFRQQLDALSRTTHQRYTLTTEMPAGTQNAVNEDPAGLARYVNDEVVMDYDFQGPWEPTGPTNFDSNLFTSPDAPTANAEPVISVASTVQYYESHGVPPSQLVVGMPYYGHGWQGVPSTGNGLYQPATGPASVGNGLDEAPGTADYNEILNYMASNPSYHWYFDPWTGSTWVYSASDNGGTFWSIENPQEVFEKALYIDAKGLAGASMWDLAGDYDNQLTSALTVGLAQGLQAGFGSPHGPGGPPFGAPGPLGGSPGH
ncbi:MAG: glycoside hydrolase family 18 protein [Acidimicrobiales bacterium]